MNSKNKIFLSLVLLLFVILAFTIRISKNNHEEHNSEYTLEKNYTNNGIRYEQYHYIDKIVKTKTIPDISYNKALLQIQNDLAILEAQFLDKFSPYPGTISNEIACKNEYKPIFTNSSINNSINLSIDLFANERFLYVCNENLITYFSNINYIFESNNFRKIETFWLFEE